MLEYIRKFFEWNNDGFDEFDFQRSTENGLLGIKVRRCKNCKTVFTEEVQIPRDREEVCEKLNKTRSQTESKFMMHHD